MVGGGGSANTTSNTTDGTDLGTSNVDGPTSKLALSRSVSTGNPSHSSSVSTTRKVKALNLASFLSNNGASTNEGLMRASGYDSTAMRISAICAWHAKQDKDIIKGIDFEMLASGVGFLPCPFSKFIQGHIEANRTRLMSSKGLSPLKVTPPLTATKSHET